LNRILRILRTAAAVFGTTIALFAAANGVAALILDPPPGIAPDMMTHIIWPTSERALPILRSVFPDEDNGLIKARLTAPLFAMHPTLPMMTARTENTLYQVGAEGARIGPGQTNEDIQRLLLGEKPFIFLLGGSTMFGHGAKPNETIAFFLGQLLPDFTVINFGAQGYTQGAEIKKLIYLLQVGYRPKSVVFLDGWNDLMHLARSNMRSVDHFLINSHAIKRGEIAFTPRASFHRPNYWHLLAESLPLYRLWVEKTASVRGARDIKFDRDAFLDGFDFLEADLAYREWGEFSEIHRPALTAKVLDYYSQNLTLIAALRAGYDFDALVVYQPIGLFDPSNPFVLETARMARGYRYADDTVRAVRAAIASNRLAMIDGGRALEAVGGHRYMDVAHYTPASNQALAQFIADCLNRSCPPR